MYGHVTTQVPDKVVIGEQSALEAPSHAHGLLDAQHADVHGKGSVMPFHYELFLHTTYISVAL